MQQEEWGDPASHGLKNMFKKGHTVLSKEKVSAWSQIAQASGCDMARHECPRKSLRLARSDGHKKKMLKQDHSVLSKKKSALEARLHQLNVARSVQGRVCV